MASQPKSDSGPGEVPNKVASDVGRLGEKLPGRQVVASREDVSQCREHRSITVGNTRVLGQGHRDGPPA